jgi:hypothetical protein
VAALKGTILEKYINGRRIISKDYNIHAFDLLELASRPILQVCPLPPGGLAFSFKLGYYSFTINTF